MRNLSGLAWNFPDFILGRLHFFALRDRADKCGDYDRARRRVRPVYAAVKSGFVYANKLIQRKSFVRVTS